ncbi:hypothetical protein Mfer_0631 [Methanothermus fervidus DSM 2088]|uniref:Uncharacterized protein n=1 Tax=Methanothermus fervidus (strain ATCC 43054 / DSM 2088 / JCM 10308 / V24 S) TaxID=523846 RepID=E3GYP8_METFV|nr:hypothetical protein [Methanothermus fervidus]ADP77430.1 hypothetical protein Mfer_0631 [Methanothermus fervidus DSM 2088]
MKLLAFIPPLLLLYGGMATILFGKNIFRLILGISTIEISVILFASILISMFGFLQWIIIISASVLVASEAVLVAFIVSLSKRIKIREIDELKSLRW